MSRLPSRVPILGAILAVAACGSSPPSAFYALSAEEGQALATSAHTVRVRRPTIAGYLDRPEIVKKLADHRLAIADGDRWGAPLDEMLERILAQDLERRLSGSAVVTDDGATAMDADVVVAVDVRRFDLDGTGRVVLEAEVSTERGEGRPPVETHPVLLAEPPTGGSVSALVSTMSLLLGRLADQIALLVRKDAPRG
jgi:uncharacterized protein